VEMTDAKWNMKLLGPTFSHWKPEKPPSRQIAVLMSGEADNG
jgi:hypothetical protein